MAENKKQEIKKRVFKEMDLGGLTERDVPNYAAFVDKTIEIAELVFRASEKARVLKELKEGKQIVVTHGLTTLKHILEKEKSEVVGAFANELKGKIKIRRMKVVEFGDAMRFHELSVETLSGESDMIPRLQSDYGLMRNDILKIIDSVLARHEQKQKAEGTK